ncbi:hypothetical protein M3Y94_01324800 [Aphelenchoides besseyi]|nr:hypothetical protein M3Y94_01324800 [Aphelenchoides besseyi]
MIGAALLGAKQCVGYELDEEVTAICRENIVEAEVEDQCEVITRDILAPDAFEKEEPFDLVLMNPPFGTKNNEGTDLRFVRTALETIKPDGSVYSLHKTSTRSGIQRRAQTWGVSGDGGCRTTMGVTAHVQTSTQRDVGYRRRSHSIPKILIFSFDFGFLLVVITQRLFSRQVVSDADWEAVATSGLIDSLRRLSF